MDRAGAGLPGDRRALGCASAGPGLGHDDRIRFAALADHRMYLAKQAGRNRYVLDERGEAYPIVVPETGAGRSAS